MTPNHITTAIDQFVEDIRTLPTDLPVDVVLEKALAAEHEIRLLFALDPHHPQLQNLFLGLIDIFSLGPAARRTRARRISTYTTDFPDRYVFPVDPSYRRFNLMPCTVSNIATFRKNWGVFTHGALSKMSLKDWEHVVVAGGSVQACLMPAQPTTSTKKLNNFYQSNVYAASDIDLFLWGLSLEEAKVKMECIYRAVCAVAPWEVICVRKANTVSIHTTYPYRPIQIILRLYKSPAEILAGFDIDAACCAYDGKQVWVNPRSLVAFVRQSNTVDITRRSPSYEVRLAKYAERGFEVYIPSLSRKEISPLIYDTNLPTFPNGFARLLVLEAAFYNPGLYKHLKYPRTHRLMDGKSNQYTSRPGHSNYDSPLKWAQIPYGPYWDALTIEAMISKKDASMNSPFNPFNQGQNPHRHIFFAGTMRQCVGSFCADCENAEESSEARSAPGIYIQGPITFITANPGRQLLTGSFQPIEVGEWVREAYDPRVHVK